MPEPQPTIQGVVYQENALIFPRGTSFEDWEREVKDIQWRHRATMWHLGDAFLWGETRFGDLYVQAVEPYSEESIQTAMRVCRVFPPPRRKWKLGFSFYQVVYKRSEEEQDELLGLAAKKGLTREAFREVRKERDEAAAAAERQREAEIVAAGVTVLRPTRFGVVVAQPQLQIPAVQQPDDDGEAIGPETLHLSSEEDIKKHFGPKPEPAPAKHLSPQDAAGWLMSYTHGGQLPVDVTEALLTVLADRERLLRILDAAERCMKTGNLQPLGQAIKAARADGLQQTA
jgi:hypothetical protein